MTAIIDIQPSLRDNHFGHLLSTMNRQSGILVIVHSISWRNPIARHNQLLAFRSNGQPIEISQLRTGKSLP
jgi:hypothetical protein